MTLDEKNTFLKALNADDFLHLGAPHLAYVREVKFMGNTHFAVHSADGEPLVIAPDKDQAISAIASSDMEAVTLH